MKTKLCNYYATYYDTPTNDIHILSIINILK